MPTTVRPARADAVRNRGLLLAAADAEFAERGLDASIADIARRAGVAKGTVFSHFASKDELVTAVVSRHVDMLVAVAARLHDSSDPGGALMEFMSIAADSLQEQDLTFLQTVSESDATVAGLQTQLNSSVESLVGRARVAGAVRADVTGTDVLLLTCGLVHTVALLADPSAGSWRRYLGIVFDGLRPEGAHPLPGSTTSLPAPS